MAVRAYLEAGLKYEQSLIATSASSKTAVEASIGKLVGECPGVLANAPEPSAAENGGEPVKSARKRGELNREQRQRDELQSELLESVSLALVEVDRGPALVFARTIASLSWGDSRVAEYLQAKAALLEWELSSAHPNACADIRAWVRSGYRTLPSATKARLRERRAAERSERESLYGLRGAAPSELLARLERTSAHQLALKLARLEREHQASLRWFVPEYNRLLTSLGVRDEREESFGPPKGATVIESGKTAAGGSFTIWIAPKPAGRPAEESQCPVRIGIAENETHANGTGSGSGSEGCLGGSHIHGPSLICEEDRWRIEGQTVEGAQSVRLTLSDGKEITSPVALVPAADGGPAGFYYQVLSKPAQTPVSLSELDASGKALVTIKLSAKSACARSGPPAPKPPEPLPGGGTLVSGRVPQGPHFVIVGERMRFQGQIESNFSVLVASEDQSSGGEISETASEGPPRRPPPFQLQSQTGCQPHEYAIVYGLLTAPADTVFARAGAGLTRLRHAPIRRSMHVHGVLAYVVLPKFPTEILVRTPMGKTMFHQKLASQARETRETCEGEAEGTT